MRFVYNENNRNAYDLVYHDPNRTPPLDFSPAQFHPHGTRLQRVDLADLSTRRRRTGHEDNGSAGTVLGDLRPIRGGVQGCRGDGEGAGYQPSGAGETTPARWDR